MKKMIMATLVMLFAVGCAGGRQYTVQNDDGSYYRVSDVGHNNVARKGAQYSKFELCNTAGVCSPVAESTAVNPSFIEMLAGPGAAVGSAELIRKGLAKSGDTVNATAEGGDASAVNKGGGYCKGNCR